MDEMISRGEKIAGMFPDFNPGAVGSPDPFGVERASRLLSAAKNRELVSNLSPTDRAKLGELLKLYNLRLRKPRLYELYPDSGPFRRELYPKQISLFKAGKLFKERLFMAANRVGKTVAGGYETAAHSIGWYPPWWPGWVNDEPGEIMVGSKTTGLIKKITQFDLFGVPVKDSKGKFRITGTGTLPHDKILYESAVFNRNFPGTLSEINVKWKDSEIDFSTLNFRSYEQGRGVFEGTSQRFVWFDEEADMEIYSEALIRTMDSRGRILTTFTPLDGFTDVVMSFMPPDFRPPAVDISEEMGAYA